MSLKSIPLVLLLASSTISFNKDAIDECSRVLSEHFKETFAKITHEKFIKQEYEKLVEEEQYDPRAELKRSKQRIEKYLQARSDFAFKAKLSLESRSVRNDSDKEVNDPKSKNFIRFMSAKQGNDATTIYEDNHLGKRIKVNDTRTFNLTQNANFYTLPTSSVASAVHIPTPLYDRNPSLLRKIDWSNVDAVYRSNREQVRDLAFQLFCSESGYMRYYPAASWFWDNQDEHLDLFDCRNTEWYINSATNSKNVLIMLDMSGSMLGQRYEVAKQTTEAILETLSHNDYFNIMPFSKNAYFLDDCNGANGLLQATMRNKKALRQKMNNVSSEGKADYEKSLPHAFSVLLNLTGKYVLKTKDEMAILNNTDKDLYPHQFVFPETVLLADDEYLESVTNKNGNNKGGCENVLMIITDGAPNSYKQIFDTYNKDRSVRVFTFLVGDEAIDFNEVREMACTNRGYMVHVANMADVDEKVQHYIRRMSRTVGKHTKDTGVSWWTGVYRERLYLPRPEVYAEPVPITNQSFAVMNKMAARRKIRLKKSEARGRMFVTTISYPVVVDEKFMGVAAVNIPLTEINQKAHPSNVGMKSYFFMLDQNGFVMFHPQLRPIDPISKYHKQNYNNMDLLELEVSQSQQIRSSQAQTDVSDFLCESGAKYAECVEEIRKIVRKMVIDCDNSDVQQLDILFATETLDRVYPQTNTYYAECIAQNFVLGLAVARGDDHRIVKKQKKYEFSRVRSEWMPNDDIGSTGWIVHPHWRYCFLNDSDTNITKEQAFIKYASIMEKTGKAPALCEPRRNLVEKALIDLEATTNLNSTWDMQQKFMQDNLIHLVFFATPSGIIRYYNITLNDYDYIDPYWSIFDHIGAVLSVEHAQESYNHFITDLNRKSADDAYYRRAVRMKDTILFDVTKDSKIWYKSETDYTGYGFNENLTMLAQAYKATYLNNAVIGVTGFEFAYDFLVDTMAEHGCAPNHKNRWCVLLDEHGYVFYSNDKDISYEDYLAGKGRHLSQFFGTINRISQRAMGLLVENRFYTKMLYTDHQATCKEKRTIVMASSRTFITRAIANTFIAAFNQMARFFSFFSIFNQQLPFIEAYTASFHEGSENFPCSKTSTFYYSNKDGRNQPKAGPLVPGDRSERPCKFNSKCAVKTEAAFIEGTNLIMVWITQDKTSENCYDDTHCPLEFPSEVPFGFEEEKAHEDNCDVMGEKRKSKANDVCYPIDDDIVSSDQEPCSPAARAFLALPILISGLILSL